MPVELKDATERLYGNSGLTDDLTDKPAMALLKWAEAQLPMLVARHENAGDEAAFDEDFSNLSRIVKGVNRIVAKVNAYSSEQLQNRLGKLVEWAQELGVPKGAIAVDAYLGEMENLDELNRVLGALKVLGTAEVQEETSQQDSVIVPADAGASVAEPEVTDADDSEATVPEENAIVPAEESETDVIDAPEPTKTPSPYDEDEEDTPSEI